MPNSILVIKEQVKKYQDILTKKEELTKEYSDWLELYKDIKNMVAKLRSIYEVSQTQEAKAELDKWLKEEKDYVEIINEYSEKFIALNSQLADFNEEQIEEQADYLAKVTEYEQISRRMKEIERKSKKTAGGYELIPNAEGRNKKININYVQDYINLCEKKKSVAKDVKKLWNKVINQNESKLSYPALSEDSYYNNLSLEEQIVELENRREQIKNASGIRSDINSDNKVINIPKQYIGLYVMYGTEIKKLKKQIAENRKNYLIQNNELLNLVDDNKPKDITFEFDVIEYEDWHENESYDDNPGFMKIINIKKIHNKKGIKEKIKKAICVIAASVIVLTMVSGVARKLNKVVNNSNKLDKSPKTTMVSSESFNETKKNDSAISDTQEKNNIRLNDVFSVNENAKIFKSIYDATLQRNGLDRFDVSDYRVISGMSVNYEGELYFFYATDVNAQENIDKLISCGGKVTAVLCSNPYGYEGFYNINDVNVLNNTLGGTSR